MPTALPNTTPSVISHLEALAEHNGEQAALLGGDHTLTFAALNRAANRLAHGLRATITQEAGFIAICLPRTIERIVAALGILKAGFAYVPIDPGLHEAGRRDLAAHADALCVLADKIQGPAFGPGQHPIDIATLARTGRDDNPGIYPQPDAYAYMRYTSGSTGAPKGVLHNHRAALGQSLAYAEATGLRAGDRPCCLSFFPHPIILGTLLAGGAFTVIDPMRDGLRAIVARLRRDRVSVLSASPSSLRPLSVALQAGGRLPDLRCIALSGEPVTAADINLARGSVGADGMAINNYGTSEFTQIASSHILHDLPPGASVPVGHPPSGVAMLVLDADGAPVPPGEAGEIAVHAAFMCSGYWKRPDLTRAVFGTDKPDDGDAIYRTGDIGRMDADGVLHLLGRVDNQIKIRAFRITPEEIEAVLSTHPAVAAVAVRPYTDAHGTTLLAAFIVSAPNTVMNETNLRNLARTHLPPYMVPAAFIAQDTLPMTIAGKLDRAALPDPLSRWRRQ